MANISVYLQKILDAIYGEEVRGSIHDALSAMNQESSSAMEYAHTAKDSASASAEQAKADAERAEESAGMAAAAQEQTAVSEENAKRYSQEAVDAAGRAQASEQTAVQAKDAAVQKAGEAEDFKNAAALSEAEAKGAEERAKAVCVEVETLGAQATADAKTAQDARTAAEAAQEKAAASEKNAKASEETALYAKAAAGTARDEAVTAKESAEEDALTAVSAKDDAEAAKTAAEAARETAVQSAQSAQQYSGKPPKPQNGTWWIWDAGTQAHVDTHISCELVGPTGNGIQSIEQTGGDHSPGSTDVYTVSMTDGSSYQVQVYNGRNGTGTGDVLGISFDLIIPKESWQDGSAEVSDERLLALSTHKYLLSADQASREEFIGCNVQPKDITVSGTLAFTCDEEPTMDLTVAIIRLELSGNGAVQ